MEGEAYTIPATVGINCLTPALLLPLAMPHGQKRGGFSPPPFSVQSMNSPSPPFNPPLEDDRNLLATWLSTNETLRSPGHLHSDIFDSLQPSLKTFISCYRTPRTPEGVSEGVSEGASEGVSEGVSERVFEGVFEGFSKGPRLIPSKTLQRPLLKPLLGSGGSVAGNESLETSHSKDPTGR